MKPQKIANITLGMTTAGTFAAYPFIQYPLGALLFAGCSAATIGGWADTFAVSALFGKPLKHVPYPRFIRTDIIRKKREDLTTALAGIVQNELLTEERIQEEIQSIDMAGLLHSYIYENGGQEAITDIVQRLLADVLRELDLIEMADTLQQTLLDQAESMQVHELLAMIIDWSLQHGYDDQVIHFLVDELSKFVQTSRFELAVAALVKEVLASYEAGSSIRKGLNYVAKLNKDTLTAKIIQGISAILQDFKHRESSQRAAISAWLHSFSVRLREDSILQQQLNAGKHKLITLIRERVQVTDVFQAQLEAYQQAAVSRESNSDSNTILFPWVKDVIEQLLAKGIGENAAHLEQMDDVMKTKLIQSIPSWHAGIGKIVRDKLNTYNDDELIALFQEKAGNDLHFIRLSGTVVGGAIGMVLYLIFTLMGS